MASSNQPAETPRESFFEAAQREMLAFENKEREFRRRVKREDAADRMLPLQQLEIH